MTLPAVDLRSGIDTVYNQSSANACGPHAVVNALDAMYDHAGHSKRFSRGFIWHWARLYGGLPGQNVGVNFSMLEKTLRLNGVVTEDEWQWDDPPTVIPQYGEKGYRLVQTKLPDDGISGIKHLLCMGVPVVWIMRVGDDFYNLAGQKNWREHTLTKASAATYRDLHAVCIVGYDDSCNRLLVENSFGPAWGDGGFFGCPYDAFIALSDTWMHVDIAPINPKKVEGYTVPAYMLTADKAAFADRSKDALLQHLMAAMSTGVQPLIDACIAWGVSDKHLETLAGWERGSVRAFKLDNPGLNWDGFVWDQI